ncbi:uncharacterized protein LOC141697967 isoform X2 [Apium graveolens]|uniref:uncharacterized protein LOC141697967 isoform X2 n=1 Tax=Apium graveolens TaxID=4045 RepID=UPI003D7B38DA
MIEYAESSKNFVENVGTDSFVESDDACLSVIKQVRTGFVVGNFPDFFEYGKIRISKKFNKIYGSMIPKDIVLIIDNGDRWFCVYDHIRCQVVGVENFMEFYGVAMLWFLVMTYYGNDEFGVNIYSPRCCEIFYPSANVMIEEEFMNDLEVPVDVSIVEEKESALFFLMHLGVTLVSLDV